MTTTSVFKLWTLLQEVSIQKALPPNAVYSSEEPPPKGVVVYQTDRGKDYWVRTIQPSSAFEERVRRDRKLRSNAKGIGAFSKEFGEALDDLLADDSHMHEDAMEVLDAYIDPYGDANPEYLDYLVENDSFEDEEHAGEGNTIADQTRQYIRMELGIDDDVPEDEDFPEDSEVYIKVYRGRHKKADRFPDSIEHGGTSVTTSKQYAEAFGGAVMPGRRMPIPKEDWVVDEFVVSLADVLGFGHTGESELIIRTDGLEDIPSLKKSNSITTLQEFLFQKEALPLGAVYVSEERPPKGTVIYFTEMQTPYWIRGPQAVGEEASPHPDNVQVSDVTTEYNKEYTKAFNDFQEKFDDLLDDPSSATFKAMQDVVNHFMGQEIPKEGAPGGLGKPTGSIRAAIQQLKFSDSAPFDISPDTPEGLRLSIDGFESFSKKLRDGGRTSEVKYKIFEALVGTRYPGNDGIEIPQHHLDNVLKLRMDARQMIQISGPQYEKLMKFAQSKSPISFRTMPFGIRAGTSPVGWDFTLMTPKAKKEMAKELQAAPVFGNSADPDSQVFLQNSPSFNNIIKLLNYKVSGIAGVCISHDHADEATSKEPSFYSSSKKTNLNSIVLFDVENSYSPDKDSKNPHNSITVVHELAHAVQADLPTEMQNEIKAQYLRALDTDKGFITWYSKAGGDNREFFAECYSAYFAHTKMFEKRNPEMADLLKRIFATKMQSISVDDFEDGPSGGADAIDAHMGDINKEEKFKRYKDRIRQKTIELNMKIKQHINKGTHDVPMAETAFWQLMLKAFYVWKARRKGENPDKRKEKVIADISEELGIVIPNGHDLPRRTDENESEGVEKSLQNMITLQERKNPLPPATDRVYIHEGKPAPAGVRIYDAGEFQGGHQGVQFWLATDENAHNAVKEHGHMVEDHSGDKDATVLTHGGTRPHVVMTKPLKEGGYPVIHEGKFFNGETLASAVKSFHDNKYPLRPDENLRTLVRDGKVDLPNPSSFTDGKKVSPEDFSKRSILLRGVLQEGEDGIAKAIFQESTLVQGRWADDDAERPDPDMDAITSTFPVKIPAVHWSGRATVIGQNIADGKTLINQKMVDASAKKLYDHAQESLDARGLPDEFIVYRGHHPDDDDRETNDVLSISLSPEKAELFASKRPGGGEFGISDTAPAGREMEEAAPLLRAYRVRKSDILADTGAYTNNPYAEDELLIDWHTLRQRHVKSAKLPETVWRPSTMKMLKFLQAEVDMKKSWWTNPRGAKDPNGKSIRKEGDGGGAFGESGGVAFTSTDSGIFTPTHSERERTPKKKKRSGVDRLADFLVDDSPERKMEKEKALEKFLPLVVGLLGSTKASKDKKAIVKEGKRFHQQTSGETINNQPPRIGWAKGNKDIPREDGASEFVGKPDANAVISQKDEERRIRRLGAAADKTANAPANGDLRLRWESGGYESDALHSGSSKDKEKGDVEDPADEHVDEPFEEEDLESKNDKAFAKLLKLIEEA